MRLLADPTTSLIIQILHESNAFFGLVGEAQYYQPLVQRIRELKNLSTDSTGSMDVILTGHSLGGGLARIVGALTELPSVSFAPPGVALSHGKYVIFDPSDDDNMNRNGFRQKINGMSGLHHMSTAIVTDYDLYAFTLSISLSLP
jgi:hypothetical protein